MIWCCNQSNGRFSVNKFCGDSLTFIEEMKKVFDEVDQLNLKEIEINISGKNAEVLYQGEPIKEYDCIFAKGSFRYAPLLRSITTLMKGEALSLVTEPSSSSSSCRVVAAVVSSWSTRTPSYPTAA